MPIVITKQYQKDLQVDGSMKARAWDFVMKLNSDPDGGGLDLKMPQGVADRRVRTARVDQNFRAVLFALPPDTLVMAAIKPHDEAYAYAAGLRLAINPANGAMEMLADERIQQRANEAQSRARQPDEPQVLPYAAGDLEALGVHPDVAAAAVRLTREDDLLRLVEDLPEWQQQALLDLATGRSLPDVRSDYGVGAEPVDDPTQSLTRAVTRMSFATINDEDELRRVVEGDFEAWRTFLHPQQRELVEREVYNGPFRVTGGAGTGKTVVALHRAAHLAGRPGAKVLLCTFNRALAASLQAQLRRLTTPEVAARIDVLGVDQAVHRAVRAHDGGDLPRPLEGRAWERLWEDAAELANVPDHMRSLLTPDFLTAEFRAVVLGLPEMTEENYLWSKRPGRGVRLNRSQRSVVWGVVHHFLRGLRAQGATTFDMLAARAAEVVTPHYDHVIVDEGQDLHAAHWRFLRGLVRPGPNDLFICEDAHQRIYGDRLVLSHYGIATRGRSRRLTLNYRSSRQNLGFSLAVISGADIADSEGESESTAGYRAAFDGPSPSLCGFSSANDEAEFVVARVGQWLAGGVSPPTIGVLVRRQADQDRVRQLLRAAGIDAQVLTGEPQAERAAVVVTTMHRSKGMEFSRVLISGVEAGVVPSAFLLDRAPETERTAVLTRERSLLYVGCSRARDELVVTWRGGPSPFLLTLSTA